MNRSTPLRWYFDFVSPFAWLHWPKVRALMADTDVQLLPVLFGAVLDARGQLGPAEIPGKREFTYRHALWQARREGVPLVFPPAHPFNPVAALRLCIAAGTTADAVNAIFRWIWAEGRAADGVEALAPLCTQLQVAPERLSDAAVKQALRANTDAALQAGVFGVPTLAIGDALFWGNDAHAFALAALRDPGVLEDPEMRRVTMLPVGVRRR